MAKYIFPARRLFEIQEHAVGLKIVLLQIQHNNDGMCTINTDIDFPEEQLSHLEESFQFKLVRE